MLSSITPDLHGDAKISQDAFLLPPVSREDLIQSKYSRNFWIYLEDKGPWSLTGVSSIYENKKSVQESSVVEAGLLWHKVICQHEKIGLESEILSFVPTSKEKIEIMSVTITNHTKTRKTFIPTCAIPIYGRCAENLRDHRQVTSLLNRIALHRFGVIVKPTMLFNEKGHTLNPLSYFVLGIEQNSRLPKGCFATLEEFCGESGDLEYPEAVFKNLVPTKQDKFLQGKEAIGALRFTKKTLAPSESCNYIIIMGISDNRNEIDKILKRYNSRQKISKAWQENKNFWSEKSQAVSFATGDKNFDLWMRWVSVQPLLRRIFGCSFLPDFDYGRGGRGWRDLWQDLLLLTLTEPKAQKELLVNNFRGVRIDGSNATIIGKNKGEFIADRNQIARVWMDHGLWPFFTLDFYIQQSGDFKILSQKVPYFRDAQTWRSQKKDWVWNPKDGNCLKTKKGKIYYGSILEHLLLETLVQFFNVGEHNFIRLENADWNDALDMAPKRGESIAFTSFYMQNLSRLAELLSEWRLKEKIGRVSLAKELLILLDGIARPIDYRPFAQKRKLLARYFSLTEKRVSGKKSAVELERLIFDLRRKANWLHQHLQKNAWLKQGFFNGYYDNVGKRVEGKIKNRLRMTLAGQVFAIMSGLANKAQIKKIYRNCQRYLQDKKLKGFRLNNDFGEIYPELGRAFAFAFGEKENGAFFSHMQVMFAYALYRRGFAKEAHSVLQAIYRMANDVDKAKIYPCLPEYFNNQGRGMYSYLTGSASWYSLTLLTQAFGIRAELGDLVIAPKLLKRQFNRQGLASVSTNFAERKIKVVFHNPRKLDFTKYKIAKVLLNKKSASYTQLAPAKINPSTTLRIDTDSGMRFPCPKGQHQDAAEGIKIKRGTLLNSSSGSCLIEVFLA
jgi:cellobiose phosphorylase